MKDIKTSETSGEKNISIGDMVEISTNNGKRKYKVVNVDEIRNMVLVKGKGSKPLIICKFKDIEKA